MFRARARPLLLAAAYEPSPGALTYNPRTARPRVVVLGGGHNGLVCAAYLARAGVSVTVLERRGVVGGAAVTEEVVPGFKFSRASYLAGLLRPSINTDLGLEAKYGLKFLPRDPSSFTPARRAGDPYLLLGSDPAKNRESIAQFSRRDAERYDAYEDFLATVREIIQPILDAPPVDVTDGTFADRLHAVKTTRDVLRKLSGSGEPLGSIYELFTGSAAQLLNRWFESDMLKSTLATDAVIGAMVSPYDAGSAYVLLHHVMAQTGDQPGVWAYVEGGMGALSNAVAQSATDAGAEIFTNATARRILTENGAAVGVELEDGTVIQTECVVSCCSPHTTFLDLLSQGAGVDAPVPPDFRTHIEHTNLACGAFKMNFAVDELPEFTCFPNPNRAAGTPGPMHQGTVHLPLSMVEIDAAYRQASSGVPADRPVVELTVPSALDRTISPDGQHVVQLFVQFAPYDVDPAAGSWADPAFKQTFVDRVLANVDEFAPNFSKSIKGSDLLSPLDLERVFALPKGNIFHGALCLSQLGYARPVPGFSGHRSPVRNLFMGAAGSHPGGGVMGAPGRNCARVVLNSMGLSMASAV
eukprot:TRINITY_DN33350_c0_g1_i1.p1 TRINITY_DN33350_c0_g1~~TRINITY_DN33350_c0_g1_i1.p1  ORF type:complete len:583 (+),score=152.78 TRINITY_DN33350_c0_g1_i1:59-1807(+)